MSDSKVVEGTLADMAGEDSDETRGWEDGMKYANIIKNGVKFKTDWFRQNGYSQAYIDAWRASAESIFYTLTDEVE